MPFRALLILIATAGPAAAHPPDDPRAWALAGAASLAAVLLAFRR